MKPASGLGAAANATLPLLRPQHNAVPFGRIPHAWYMPTAIGEARAMPEGGARALSYVVVVVVLVVVVVVVIEVVVVRVLVVLEVLLVVAL